MKEALIRLFYPDRCIFCGDVSEKGCCCQDCLKQLEGLKLRQPITFREKEKHNPCCGWIAAPFSYQSVVRRAVHGFKFKGRKEAAAFFAPFIAQVIRQNFKDCPFDLITCVPMNKYKQTARGYNQADLLAQELAQILGVEYAPLALKRVGLLTQHELRAIFRKKSAELSFAINQAENVKNKRVLVVDDIFTTGSTMYACCNRLLENGAIQVFGAVVAKTL